MKVVIPYKHFGGQELKYCLRSIEMYINDPEVTIIGDVPDWIKNVSHVPFKDNQSAKFKEQNIFKKILLVDFDFLFFNDDHFLLRPLSGYHYTGTLSQRIKDYSVCNPCRITVQNTVDLYGDIPNYYRHSPFFIERDKLESVAQLNWNKEWGYCVKSVYAHLNNIQGEDYPDLKIREPLNKEKILNLIKGREYFSAGDGTLNPAMISVLETIYPSKSYFEI